MQAWGDENHLGSVHLLLVPRTAAKMYSVHLMRQNAKSMHAVAVHRGARRHNRLQLASNRSSHRVTL